MNLRRVGSVARACSAHLAAALEDPPRGQLRRLVLGLRPQSGTLPRTTPGPTGQYLAVFVALYETASVPHVATVGTGRHPRDTCFWRSPAVTAAAFALVNPLRGLIALIFAVITPGNFSGVYGRGDASVAKCPMLELFRTSSNTALLHYCVTALLQPVLHPSIFHCLKLSSSRVSFPSYMLVKPG